MSIKYSTNGNLALKVYNKQARPQLRVIKCAGNQESAYRQIVDQVFAYQAYAHTESPVTTVLANMRGSELCANVQDRAFVIATSAIASFALFYFSFFAF